MKKSILVVEDDLALAKILQFDLERAGFFVKTSISGIEAYNISKSEKFDCMIIDWMIPSINGLDLIKKLRQEKTKSFLIMLTAKTTEFDAIEGLSVGADLYLKKPISNRELIAQIKALLGYFEEDKTVAQEVLSFGNIKVDLKSIRVFINNAEIRLTKLEYDVLRFLISNQEKAISRDVLLNTIWGFNYDGATRIVDVHIYNLKKKLKQFNATLTIKAIRGVGYAIRLA